MNEIVRLAEPNAGPLKVYEDGGLDVVTRVTHEQMEFGWSKLREVITREPNARMREWADDGHSEDELRMLFGLFLAVSAAVPMSTSNLLDWLLLTDPDPVDGFVTWRMKQLSDEHFDCVLEGRDLVALGLQRVEEPTNRGPASLASIKRAIDKMRPDELRYIEQACIDRRDDLAAETV